MKEQANYQYGVISSKLNNVGETYQRMVNKFFQEELGETLEEYMDDMIVKSGADTIHAQHIN